MSPGVNLLFKTQAFSLGLFCFALPFSIAGDDFAASLLYLSGIGLLALKQQSWPRSPLNWLIPAFFFFAFAGTLFAEDPASGFSSVRSFWRYALPFFLAMALTEESLYRALKILGLATLLIGLYAAVQHFTSLDVLRSARLQSEYEKEGALWRAVGAFSHHLTFGGVNQLVWPLLWMLSWVQSLPKRDRWLFRIAGILSFFGAYASLGRSIWIGLFVSCLFLGALKLKRMSWILLLPVLMVILGVYTLQNSPAMQEQVRKLPIGDRILMGIDKGHNVDRLNMWSAGLAAVSEHPVLGLGINSGTSLQRYYDQITKETGIPFQHKAKTGVHNLFLQNWIEYGLLGSLALIAWWGYLFAQMFRHSRASSVFDVHQALRLGIMAGLLGSWSAAMFENNFRDGEVQSMILLTHGIAIYLIQIYKTEKITGDSTEKNLP